MSSGSVTPNSTTQSSSTPANLAPKKKPTPKKATPSKAKGRGSGPRTFTASMQDKQARNKDPYSSSDDSDNDTWASPGGVGGSGHKDTWEQTQKRREAAVILDNPELLMMHAQARFDSVYGTRHYFTKLLCGYLSNEEPYSHTEAEEKHQKARQERQERVKSKDYELLQRRWLHQAEEGEGDGSGGEDEIDEDIFDLL